MLQSPTLYNELFEMKYFLYILKCKEIPSDTNEHQNCSFIEKSEILNTLEFVLTIVVFGKEILLTELVTCFFVLIM